MILMAALLYAEVTALELVGLVGGAVLSEAREDEVTPAIFLPFGLTCLLEGIRHVAVAVHSPVVGTTAPRN